MTPRFVLEPEAEADLDAALAWYDEHAPNVTAKFLDAVEGAFVEIEHAPLQFHLERADVRKALVRHFPYVVFFVILPDVVSGIAVFHTSRDPAIWHRRAVV